MLSNKSPTDVTSSDIDTIILTSPDPNSELKWIHTAY